jgi:hypothetical protein
MEREELFKSCGVECVGGTVEDILFEPEIAMEYDTYIWVDFHRKRVMVEYGDGGEVIFLKGFWLSEEVSKYHEYENNLEKEIVDHASNTNSK